MTGSRQLRLGMFGLLLALLAGEVEAQDAVKTKERRPRTVSPKMSEAIRERSPKFDPAPKTASPNVAAAAEGQEVDGVLVLPKMIVSGLAFPPEEVRLSEEARVARAMKSHPGLKLGNIGETGNIAVLLEREETLAAHKADTSALIARATLDANTTDAKKIRSLLGAALQQSNHDWEHGRGGASPLHDASPPPPTPDRKKDRRRE